MSETKRWIKRGIVIVVLGGITAAFVFKPGLRHGAHDLWHQGLVLLKLETAMVEGATFWCPMHPEIRRKAPGTCPI